MWSRENKSWNVPTLIGSWDHDMVWLTWVACVAWINIRILQELLYVISLREGITVCSQCFEHKLRRSQRINSIYIFALFTKEQYISECKQCLKLHLDNSSTKMRWNKTEIIKIVQRKSRQWFKIALFLTLVGKTWWKETNFSAN